MPLSTYEIQDIFNQREIDFLNVPGFENMFGLIYYSRWDKNIVVKVFPAIPEGYDDRIPDIKTWIEFCGNNSMFHNITVISNPRQFKTIEALLKRVDTNISRLDRQQLSRINNDAIGMFSRWDYVQQCIEYVWNREKMMITKNSSMDMHILKPYVGIKIRGDEYNFILTFNRYSRQEKTDIFHLALDYETISFRLYDDDLFLSFIANSDDELLSFLESDLVRRALEPIFQNQLLTTEGS